MSSPAYVLDASALLALMLREAGARETEERLPDAAVSAVNLSEVVAKLQERGVPDDLIAESLVELNLLVLVFDEEQAVLVAGRLRRDTRAAGLSLGDRACLTLAMTLGARAVTADPAWGRLELPVRIEVVR